MRRCRQCRFAYVADPWTDFGRIYDDRYYAGRGADPLVDYEFELAEPDRTVRLYEWRGVTRLVGRLVGGLSGARWLDFGCGNGGLVRHAASHTSAEVVGFEEGSIADRAREAGITVIGRDALDRRGAEFDVVTAIEVLEHAIDPIAELRRIRRLLRPGGLLLLTTGNAAPHAQDLSRWGYVVPEIHVSFFEPDTLAQAMARSGFEPGRLPPRSGFADIIKFKVLKNLRVHRRSALTDALPAEPLAALADRRTNLRRMPIGWAR
jgi:SAM-dependent methyltransferase